MIRNLLGSTAALVYTLFGSVVSMVIAHYLINWLDAAGFAIPPFAQWIAEQLNFTSSPWFWGLCGMLFGLLARPVADWFFVGQRLSSLHVEVGISKRALASYLREVWSADPNSVPVMSASDRSETMVLFDKMDRRRLPVPKLADRTDLNFAVVALRYLQEVSPFFDKETEKKARIVAQEFCQRANKETEVKEMLKLMVKEHRQQTKRLLL